MREFIILFIHAVATVMRVVRPGGVRAVVAESILAKHQLLILSRSRRRAPNLRILDRIIAGFCSLWIQPRRLRRVAIAFKPSTFLGFHRAMVQCKYRLLFSRHWRDKHRLLFWTATDLELMLSSSAGEARIRGAVDLARSWPNGLTDFPERFSS